jgi:hypothetical protein
MRRPPRSSASLDDESSEAESMEQPVMETATARTSQRSEGMTRVL